jgi:hypothetical protein
MEGDPPMPSDKSASDDSSDQDDSDLARTTTIVLAEFAGLEARSPQGSTSNSI